MSNYSDIRPLIERIQTNLNQIDATSSQQSNIDVQMIASLKQDMKALSTNLNINDSEV